jgi:hypothetical protein
VSAIACNLLATDDARHSQRNVQNVARNMQRCAAREERLRTGCSRRCRRAHVALPPKASRWHAAAARSLIGSHKLAAPTSEHCRTAVAV